MLKKILEYITNSCYHIIKIEKKNEGGIMNKGINVLDVAKFLIYKFNTDDVEITQLQLQKLLYFIEAYYMVKYDKSKLYNQEFYAWMYGPVCKEVYEKYKYFMQYPIVETYDENNINNEDVINSVNEIYESLGKYSATDLVKLTHINDSPWFNAYKIKNDTLIPKKETKEWFKRKFIKNV